MCGSIYVLEIATPFYSRVLVPAVRQQRPELERLALHKPVRIVHQIQINVAQAQVVVAATTSRLHLGRLMVRVPQFRHHENLVAPNDAGRDFGTHRLADGLLGAVQEGGVKVPVAAVDGQLDGGHRFLERLHDDKWKETM